jgi:hypothetical protein
LRTLRNIRGFSSATSRARRSRRASSNLCDQTAVQLKICHF